MGDPLATITSRASDRSLTLITKRTYRIVPGKAVVLADEQLPLVRDVTLDPDRGHLRDDLDLCVHKHRTDVVVQGQAHAPGGRAVTTLEVSVAVGEYRKRLLVRGDRRCRYSRGQARFDDPEPFEAMPLVYTRAYGGSDESAREELQGVLAAMEPFVGRDLSRLNLCVYPRNSVGMGYVIHEGEAMDELPLPNLEDPEEQLTATTLAVGDASNWYRQPMPAAFDWFSYDWFPRKAHLGFTFRAAERDDLPKPEDPAIREVRMGWLSPDVFEPKTLEQLISDQVCNGASPGLAVPYLKGNEPVELLHLDAEHPRLSFRLPGDKPRLFVTPLDEERRELEPVLFSVVIHKERNLLSMVWAGRTQTYVVYGEEQERKVPFEVVWK